METITPGSSVSCVEEHGEVHFAISGFWELEAMHSFLEQLNEASMPMVRARQPIRVLGDMEGFVPQSREAGDAIRNHLMNACKFGLERIAILKGSPLTKMQYKRLSAGLEVGFFDDKGEATDWLRA